MFGGEIGFKNLSLDRFGDAPGIVFDANNSMVILLGNYDDNMPLGDFSGDEGVFGILKQIDEDLGEFVLDTEEDNSPIDMLRQFNVLFLEDFAQKREGIFEAGVRVERLFFFAGFEKVLEVINGLGHRLYDVLGMVMEGEYFPVIVVQGSPFEIVKQEIEFG